MTTQNSDEANPAYAVLYTCEPGGRWRAIVVDIPGCEAFGNENGLFRDAQAYTVLYTPLPSGNWCAQVLDLPGCEATGDCVSSAKNAATNAAKLAFQRHRKHGEPIPASVTVGGYVRAEYEFGGLESEGAMAAATQAVRDYRERCGPLPFPTSVCGCVSPERNDDETEKADN